jgi:dCTP deaminase
MPILRFSDEEKHPTCSTSASLEPIDHPTAVISIVNPKALFVRWFVASETVEPFNPQQSFPSPNRSVMSIGSDRWIREQAVNHRMIEPFSEKQVADGVISYGLSSYGYDLRVSDEFKIFTNVNSAIIDPKAFDERSFVSVQAPSVIVPPNSFALARSVEYFRIPRDVLTICVGKSTYARCGIIVNVTPFEPEWEGFVTLEISNTTPLPARVYANEGLCQILFFRSDEPCEVSYADRKGKYQKQQGIVLPKL